MKKLSLFVTAILFAILTFAQVVPSLDSVKAQPISPILLTVKIDSLQAKLAKQHDLFVAIAKATGNADDTATATPQQFVSDVSSVGSRWKSLSTTGKILAVIGLLIALFFMLTEYHLPGFIKMLLNMKFGKVAPVVLMLLTFGLASHAQVISNQRLQGYYSKHPEKAFLLGSEAPSTPAANTSGYILSLEPSFGLNALTIQKGLNGWETSGIVAPAFTYGLSVGEYTANADNMTVKNYLTLGAGVAGGIIPSTNLTGSFQGYGFVTIYNYATLGAGYDMVTKKPFFGIAASVPLFTFKQGLGSYILKLF